jgi:hypothetical protein
MEKVVIINVMRGGKSVDMLEVSDFTSYSDLFDELKHILENLKEVKLEDD